jgi:hypothetical protein
MQPWKKHTNLKIFLKFCVFQHNSISYCVQIGLLNVCIMPPITSNRDQMSHHRPWIVPTQFSSGDTLASLKTGHALLRRCSTFQTISALSSRASSQWSMLTTPQSRDDDQPLTHKHDKACHAFARQPSLDLTFHHQLSSSTIRQG